MPHQFNNVLLVSSWRIRYWIIKKKIKWIVLFDMKRVFYFWILTIENLQYRFDYMFWRKIT